MTGGDTHHYTNEEHLVDWAAAASFAFLVLSAAGEMSRYVGRKGQRNSPSGNRTPVSRVTGGDTLHYTNEDHLVTCAIATFLDSSAAVNCFENENASPRRGSNPWSRLWQESSRNAWSDSKEGLTEI